MCRSYETGHYPTKNRANELTSWRFSYRVRSSSFSRRARLTASRAAGFAKQLVDRSHRRVVDRQHRPPPWTREEKAALVLCLAFISAAVVLTNVLFVVPT
jgi:hypothetical protein